MEEREERAGGGGAEVERVVMEEEGYLESAEAEEEDKGMVRWEKLLPRMPVRVLLVEADDSTRQIIAALLRKCSYRVAATSDGLKAWETLKEKHCNIDLVLTEVDLPSISGFGLLSMIMDHANCKNIPVIMMSSHDSVSMVFKCMMKGAADFLVKPIRKNELRNLWQHVWRRQLTISGHDGIHGHQEENGSYMLNVSVGKGIHSCDLANKECSEQDSDAQSSCTRSEMETEKADKQNVPNLKLPKIRKTSSKEHTVIQNDLGQIQLQSASMISETEAKATAITDADLVAKYLENDNASENHRKRRKTSKEAADLLNMFENQQQFGDISSDSITRRNGFSGIVEASLNENDFKGESSPVPHLELSLRRCEESSCNKKEKDAANTLNHSNSSAFSRYCSRTVEPILPKPLNLTAQSKEFTCFSYNLRDRESPDASRFNSSRANMTFEDAKTFGAGSAGEDGMTVQCNSYQVIPFSFPVGGMPLNNMCSAYGLVGQPVYYQQSAHPMWHTIPSTWQERAPYENSTIQSEPETIKPVQDDNSGDHSVRTPFFHSAENQDEPQVLLDEHGHEPSIAGESTSASICSGDLVKCNSSRCASIGNDTSSLADASNVSRAPAGNGHVHGLFTHEGTKPTDFPQLSHREAALNKFRLKRKERCFKKKVRYESRKILAEQRPRVKGQFVRKVQLVSQSKPYGCNGSNLAPG